MGFRRVLLLLGFVVLLLSLPIRVRPIRLRGTGGRPVVWLGGHGGSLHGVRTGKGSGQTGAGLHRLGLVAIVP